MKLFPSQLIQKKGEQKNDRVSLQSLVACGIRLALLSVRLGPKKLAFLQERDDWLSAASAE
jgi:hypothetical protein